MSYKADIPADWAEQVSLLQRAVRNPDVFRFIVVQYNYFTVVQKISALLRQLDPERPLLQLRCEKEDYYSLIEKLNQHSGFIILENFQYLAKSPDLYTGFNQRRDQISARPIQLICCMPADEQNVRRCKENLRDFWSIRDLLLKFMDQASEQSGQTSTGTQSTYSDLGGLDFKSKRVELKRLLARAEELSHPVVVDIDLLSSIYRQISKINEDLGEFNTALEWAEKWLNLLQQHNSSESELAKAFDALADNYYYSGQYLKSLGFNQKSVAAREMVLPAEHPDLATSYNNLAVIYGALGEHQKSLEYHQKTLAIREKVLLPENLDLADSYSNLAVTYGALGEHQKSLGYHQKALAVRQKVLPSVHPSLATSYNNLATTYGALGEYQKQLEYNQKALAIWEKILPPEHPDLATSYNNLAWTYNALGEHQKDLEYNLKALAIREKVLPPEHPSLATSYNNLAWTYNALGDVAKAVSFMRRALAILEKSLPAAHPDVEMAKKSLAFLEKELRQTKS